MQGNSRGFWLTLPIISPNYCDVLQARHTFRVEFSLVWITKAFNLEWLLNLWERGNLKTNQVKKGLWRNWKMLTLKTREKVGKNTSKCRSWFTNSLSESLALSTRFWASETRFWTRSVNANILRHSKRSCKAFVLATMACFGCVILCFN